MSAPVGVRSDFIRSFAIGCVMVQPAFVLLVRELLPVAVWLLVAIQRLLLLLLLLLLPLETRPPRLHAECQARCCMVAAQPV